MYTTAKQLADREINARSVWAKRMKIPVKEVALNTDGTRPDKATANETSEKVSETVGAEAAGTETAGGEES